MFAIRLLLSSVDDHLSLHTSDAHPEGSPTPLEPDEAWIRVRKILQDRWNLPHLRSLASEWTDAGQVSAWDDQELEQRYHDWVSRGEVQILAQPQRALAPGHASSRGLVLKDDPPAPPKKKKTAFIALELVDQDGEPVPDQPYKVELPNGSSRTGNLDSQGKARIEGIDPPGTCKISFPELDAADWKPA